MKTLVFALAASLALGASAAGFKAGEGIANDRASGGNARDVTFVTRGNGNPYGYIGWNMAIGGTVLPWAIPNDESNVYGLRVNLGWGRYVDTYGLDAGAFSRCSGCFGGIAANVCGNAVEKDAAGIQIGAVNAVQGTAAGLQVAFVNFAGELKGCQIGVLNFNAAGITMPIINFGF